MRSHGGYGFGKSPLEMFNPDKILFMGIPYRRTTFENESHISTKCSFENVLIPCCERRVHLVSSSIIREIVAAFLVMLSTCLSKRREESIKIPESRITSIRDASNVWKSGAVEDEAHFLRGAGNSIRSGRLWGFRAPKRSVDDVRFNVWHFSGSSGENAGLSSSSSIVKTNEKYLLNY